MFCFISYESPSRQSPGGVGGVGTVDPLNSGPPLRTDSGYPSGLSFDETDNCGILPDPMITDDIIM